MTHLKLFFFDFFFFFFNKNQNCIHKITQTKHKIVCTQKAGRIEKKTAVLVINSISALPNLMGNKHLTSLTFTNSSWFDRILFFFSIIDHKQSKQMFMFTELITNSNLIERKTINLKWTWRKTIFFFNKNKQRKKSGF